MKWHSWVMASFLWAASVMAQTPVVVIDAGHGGAQNGAQGVDGYLEKTLSLQVALRVKAELQKRMAVEVILTRQSDVDVSLAQRVSLATLKEPSVFVSIHGNSLVGTKRRSRVHGIETYFLSANASGAQAQSTAARENAEVSNSVESEDTLDFILRDLKRSVAHVHSSRLAYRVHERLIEATKAVDRGVQQAPFFVLTGVEAPAILVELGFLTHPQEGKKLRTQAYQQTLAAAIAEGVVAFLKDSTQAQNGP